MAVCPLLGLVAVVAWGVLACNEPKPLSPSFAHTFRPLSLNVWSLIRTYSTVVDYVFSSGKSMAPKLKMTFPVSTLCRSKTFFCILDCTSF